MKLSTRLGLLVINALLGMGVLTGVALYGLHDSMLDDHKGQIRTTLHLAANQIAYFQKLERAGKLSRREAQKRAVEAMTQLRDKGNYVFARDAGQLVLVHPDKRKLGKADPGDKLPDGRTLVQAYDDALREADFGFVQIQTRRPNGDVPLPKLNAVMRIPDWGWTIGTGMFLDDIDLVYKQMAVRLLLIGGEPEQASHTARAIAAGDLSQRVRCGHQDSLLDAIAQMQAGLREMIENLHGGAGNLESAVMELAEQMRQIRAVAARSMQVTEGAAKEIESMSACSSQVTACADETESHSVRSSQLASRGEELVNRAAEEIQLVAGQVVDASAQIASLAERSREVDGIALEIKEIADQTNLLALNAAIEAARAGGGSGRGFAVVADEVRKLAKRSAQATERITGTIQGIQADTDLVVARMDGVKPVVIRGVDLAREAALALREINSGMAQALDHIRSMAKVASAQALASHSVADNIASVYRIVDESQSSMTLVNADVEGLSTLAQELKASVGRFRL
ncbi:methyl-accepting chemotaxis protein [Chromobacterium sp. IIBBL 290-4]|uniref:methyl-accepting chemotaxis protein n=1 Tax=Chromobacterium sp. IIBBL 290-4 TaxID=2953890 RepID=UPI0020B66355|nr:methyl-accepting chemotaxis protein [Chromobacterium sp. IIBBL 290-4]UTH73609.1 methyl-accepting chemotaxis protein [Chromobacterium sp. IIBBL 290-4]